MADERRPGLLCISTYEKGQAFLREAARLGCPATLLTTEKLRHADWPWDALAAFHVMPDKLTAAEVLPYITRLFRHTPCARIVALDEFDLETAALAREHLRLPGMGQTATRNFRDKLAMRDGAQRAGIAVPAFSSVADHHALWQFMERTGSGATGGVWLLKPRMSASAIGIQRIDRQEQVWPLLEQLGDAASDHLLESFVPGEIYHVDAISWQGEVLFSVAHKYGKPPMQTMHEGGVFTTRTLDREGYEARGLTGIHTQTLKALGMVSGVTHSEFIRAHADGQLYFLETAARVGGVFIAEVIEYACGVNPWAEWARIEVAQMRGEEYALPATLRESYAGSVICLARQQQPDLSSYDAPEVVHRMQKHHHAGLIVQSDSAVRVEALLEAYGRCFLDDFCARLEPPAKPTS
jgi:biotin carboxylase